MSNARERVQDVFRETFDDPELVLRDEMTADDVAGWDSMAHINLIISLERRLGIKFATAEISQMKDPGQNVGSMLRLIEGKLARGQSAK
jgi:acyl carrier protein